MTASQRHLSVVLGLCLFISGCASSSRNKDSNISDPTESHGVIVTDHWFFVGDKKDVRAASFMKTNLFVVKEGEVFGFRIAFVPIKKTLQLLVQLRVPNSPERFPAHDGMVTISVDRKAVLVDDPIDGTKGATAFYWGVGPGDPKGEYVLTFSLDGAQVDSYRFTVK